MHIDEAEFWRLTPRQLAYLTKRHRQQQEREELLYARLSSVIVNTSFHQPKELTCPADFMPGYKRPVAPEQSDDEIAAQINAVLGPISVQA